MAIEVDKIPSGVWAEVPIAYSKDAPNPIDYAPCELFLMLFSIVSLTFDMKNLSNH